jgi:hypothetical protein
VIDLAAESTAVLQSGFGQSTWTISDLWVAVVGIGGDLRRSHVVDITAGDRPATRGEHNIIATALNDYFTDHDQDHPVALWDDLVAHA